MNATSRSAIRTITITAGVLLLGLALASCDFLRRKPMHHELLSFNTTAQAAALKRVAVLPFYLSEGIGRSAQVIDESMPASLRELALNEIATVSMPKRELLLPEDPIANNHISIDQLLKIRDTLHCDAVFIGRIKHYDSYDPISVGVSAHIISCLDGSVVWSASGEFDGHRDDVQDEIKDWYEHTNGGSTANISGWKIVLQSPRLFTRYVCDRLAQSIPIVPVAPAR